MAALSVSLLLLAYFPYVTYAAPCIASLPIMVTYIEFKTKPALAAYISSLLPAFLFCESEAKIVFILFAGFYPILKGIIEKINIPALEYIFKFLFFNIDIFVIYLVTKYVFDIPFDEFGSYAKYGVLLFVFLANAAFLAFDFCIASMSSFYIMKIQPSVRKIFKI